MNWSDDTIPVKRAENLPGESGAAELSVDWSAETQPVYRDDSWMETKPVRPPRRRRFRDPEAKWLLLLILLAVGAYFFAPLRTNLLILGIDRAPEGTALGRSDTMILVSVVPWKPYVGMLSIPRDLWVTLPEYGENRINAAHFFAESEEAGSGSAAAVEAVRESFDVPVRYFVRFRFEALKEVVEAMGGVEVSLESPAGGYPAGTHRLNGDQALAFVRDRAGTDDFFRMRNGQLFIRAVWRQAIRPATWPRLPAVAVAALRAVDTNIPAWQWPRLAVALLRAGPEGIETRTLTRDMVTPFTTSGGAAVLLPNWGAIEPVLEEMFGR